MNSEDTKLAERAERHRYELSIGGKTAAHIDYQLGDGYVEMIHTEVEPEHEGKGLGSQLAKFALDDVRSRGLKVVPSCSYVATYIQRHPDYQNLVRDK